jgi:UDP-N-acetylmuramoyl-L-alanyl-D-glutamate--2,6-diaminopimelate ligase
MGMAAARDSDFVILTSDNPRSEDPIAIINDAVVGARRFDTPLIVEPDREKAIFAAIAEARSGDIVLLTGKGHEDYQILADRRIHFSDKEVALRAIRERSSR